MDTGECSIRKNLEVIENDKQLQENNHSNLAANKSGSGGNHCTEI